MTVKIDKGAKIERWEQALANPSVALRQIGALMVAESQEAFRNQRFGGQAWPERRVPNVFGIIQDLYEGKKSIPKRRFEARPALRDTGRLAASIAWQLVGTDAVEVGSNLPYAADHQVGGKVQSKPLNEQVRAGLNAFLKTRTGKKWRPQLGWLLNKKFAGKSIEQTVPARPFVGITDQTIADVQEAVSVKIMEAG